MKIRDLLSNETKWTKGAFARDVYGSPESWTDESAFCFCLLGAIYRCYNGPNNSSEIFKKIWNLGHRDLVAWNDKEERTFGEIKDLVEKLDI